MKLRRKMKYFLVFFLKKVPYREGGWLRGRWVGGVRLSVFGVCRRGRFFVVGLVFCGV